MKAGLRYRLGGHVGTRLLDVLLGSARYEITGDAAFRGLLADGQPVIYALWHGRLVPLTYLHRGEGIATLISRSADGEYIARVLSHWGYRAVRGSSTRGGSSALREMVRAARRGQSLAFTPDGPRGPKQRMKPGVIHAAQLTGLPIVPMSASTSRGWWFEGWDSFLVPKPFARIHAAYGEPWRVARDSSPADLALAAARLEGELNRLTAAADEWAGRAAASA